MMFDQTHDCQCAHCCLPTIIQERDEAMSELRASQAEIFRKAAKHELANITPKNQDKIVAGREAFDLSLRLVSLRFDVPVELDINDCAIAAREVAA